ncbi:MAG: hypothetical protein ACREPK_01950 [Rhodanobacteraceae bacterium]
MTKLEKPLRREIDIESKPYTLTLDRYRLKLTPKGHRNGFEIPWSVLLQLGGREQAALASITPVI